MSVSGNDLIRVSARCAGTSNQDIVNVFHFRVASAMSGLDADLVSDLKTHMETAFAELNSVQSNSVNPIDLKIDKVTWNGSDEAVVYNFGTYPWGGAYNPSASGDDLPPMVTGLVKLLTHLGKVYGRKFIGGMMEAGNVSGFYNSAVVTALTNFAALFITLITGASGNTYEAGVLSKKTAAFQKFTSARVDSVYATQRRRRIGSGS